MGKKAERDRFVQKGLGVVRLNKLMELIEKLPEGERESIFAMAEAYKDSLTREKAQVNFMEFVKIMWPGLSMEDTTL